MPVDVTWINIDKGPWCIVRSFNAAVDWVQKNGFPNVISFDHDLGYEEFDTDENGKIIVTVADTEKNGYDFAKFLVEYDLSTSTMPDNFTFTVHSMNPIGAENIRKYLENYIFVKNKKLINNVSNLP